MVKYKIPPFSFSLVVAFYIFFSLSICLELQNLSLTIALPKHRDLEYLKLLFFSPPPSVRLSSCPGRQRSIEKQRVGTDPSVVSIHRGDAAHSGLSVWRPWQRQQQRRSSRQDSGSAWRLLIWSASTAHCPFFWGGGFTENLRAGSGIASWRLSTDERAAAAAAASEQSVWRDFFSPSDIFFFSDYSLKESKQQWNASTWPRHADWNITRIKLSRRARRAFWLSEFDGMHPKGERKCLEIGGLSDLKRKKKKKEEKVEEFSACHSQAIHP